VTPPRANRFVPAALWIAAFLLMAGAAVWQRLTGPTHPKRAAVSLDGQDVRFRLLRSATTGEPFLVSVPAPEGASGLVRWRRFPTSEPFQDLAMRREGGALAALLPSQPPAGKLEYALLLRDRGGREVAVPAGGPLVMRFKGDVPPGVLVPHVVAMFLGMMIGLRAALAAALGRPEARRYAWVTVALIGIGGLVLGPIVQKHAFGAYWTGWPWGEDLTDNKTLFMWLAWVAAVAVLSRRRDPGDRLARAAVAVAAAATIAVYVVPHSLRGSQLDYSRIEAGASAKDSVTTGR
jgi:hypothetical protein